MSRDGDPPVRNQPAAQPAPAAEDGAADGGVDAAAGPAGTPADAGAALHAEVRDALAGLAARLDREHERAAHREAVIDRLHEENQRLRRGELQAMLEPVRAALYRVHDNARRESRRLTAPDLTDPPDPKRTAVLLEALADDVADALARIGVERFTVEPGAPYDASRHRPVAVTPVDDPSRDGTVTTVESDGFEQSGKVLRKAAVGVARLTAPARRDDERDGGQDGERSDTAGTGGGGAGDDPDGAPETGSNGAGATATGTTKRLRGAARGESMDNGRNSGRNTGPGTDR